MVSHYFSLTKKPRWITVNLQINGPSAKPKQYINKYEAELTRTEKLYGVDKSIITAILLVETGPGRIGGNPIDFKHAFDHSSFDGSVGARHVLGFDSGFKENFQKKI